ncbi:hypothetical protein [Nonlabens sp. Asnod2-A12]|uniref:hypothetical protein n=1 Tax=Nonlabens sp. Asnod2-A12 TaxID=3160578 RepID=UPI003866DFB7
MIIGTWRFEKNCDLRTRQEKVKYSNIPYCPRETDTNSGNTDRVFKSNNQFEFYETQFGIYKIKNNVLIIEHRILQEHANLNPDAIKRYLKRKLIEKKDDGFYYYKPQMLSIKSISDDQIEFGSDKQYTIWKRID